MASLGLIRRRMKLSVVIPCYNEAKTIRQIVARVSAAPVLDKEIIVVDDNSDGGWPQ